MSIFKHLFHEIRSPKHSLIKKKLRSETLKKLRLADSLELKKIFI